MTVPPSQRPRHTPPFTAAEQARRQGALIEALEEDRSFQRQNGTLVYALDTNVVLFLIDPIPRALPSHEPGDARLMGFAAIFPDDPQQASEILARALADFLVEELSPGIPLLIPAPFDADIYRNVDRSIRDVAEFKPDGPRVAQLLGELSRSAGVDDKTQDVANQVLHAAILARSTDLMRNLRVLLDSRRLAIIATQSDELADPLPTVFEVDLQDGKGLFDRIMTGSLWRQTLRKLAPTRHGVKTDAKADALARLEIWNRRLVRMSHRTPDQTKLKMMFLSGDAALLEPRLNQGRTPAITDQERFLAENVRHPRGFLPRLSILQENRSGPLGDADDAAGLPQGAPWQNGSHFLDLWAEWRPDGTAAEQAEFTEGIKTHWHKLLLSASLRYRLEPGSGDAPAGEAGVADEITKWQERVKPDIEKRYDEFWQECFYFATQGLVIFGAAAQFSQNARNAPPIFLGSWDKTAAFIDLLMTWTSPQKFDLAMYKKGISDLEKEFQQVSASDHKAAYFYAYYLCHAAMFAGRGQWLIAAKVASYAALRVTPGERKPDSGNGREAFYLEAFCLRHAAKRLSDLENLESLLDRAEAIETQEGQWTSDNRQPVQDCVAVRFQAERLSIRLSRWLFARFSEPAPATMPDDLAQLLAGFASLLSEVQEQSQRALTAMDGPTATDEGRRRAESLHRLQLRLLLNCLAIPLYGVEVPMSPDRVRLLLLETQMLRQSLEIHFPVWGWNALSPFGEWVIACATARYSATAAERDEGRRQVLAKSADDALLRLGTFPFDQRRLNEMRASALNLA